MDPRSPVSVNRRARPARFRCRPSSSLSRAPGRIKKIPSGRPCSLGKVPLVPMTWHTRRGRRGVRRGVRSAARARRPSPERRGARRVVVVRYDGSERTPGAPLGNVGDVCQANGFGYVQCVAGAQCACPGDGCTEYTCAVLRLPGRELRRTERDLRSGCCLRPRHLPHESGTATVVRWRSERALRGRHPPNFRQLSSVR